VATHGVGTGVEGARILTKWARSWLKFPLEGDVKFGLSLAQDRTQSQGARVRDLACLATPDLGPVLRRRLRPDDDHSMSRHAKADGAASAPLIVGTHWISVLLERGTPGA
jgi:hypothetical protein